MTNIYFTHNYQSTKRIEKAISLIINFSRTEKKVISTKIYVLPEQWDKKTERITNHAGALLLNLELNKIKTKYQELELETLRNGEQFTLSRLNATLGNKPPETLTFNTFMYKSIISQTNLEIETIKDHKKTYKLFTNLFPALKFENFSIKQVTEFNNWLQAHNYAIATIYKHHKNIKKYLNLAAVNGIYEYSVKDFPYTHLKVNKGSKTRCFLEEKELKLLETVMLPEHLEKYRKMFLFMCYTGLRISDFMRIEQNMIVEDLLILKPKKTSQHETEVRLPIKDLFCGKPYEIWKEFDFNFPNKSKGFDLKLNVNIKLIAEIANINKHLSCHVARHTFLTFIALRTGNVLKVMKLGGLRKIDTAMIYIHLAEQDSRDFAKSVDWSY